MTTSQTREAREIAGRRPKTTARSVADDFATTTREVATEVADRANAVAARLPEAAAATTRVAVEEAGSPDGVRLGPDARRRGLALARARSRPPASAAPIDSWSCVALIPATAMTFTLLDRYGRRSPLRVVAEG